MLSLTLVLSVVLALLIGSTPLLVLAVTGLAIKFHPITALTALVAVLVWLFYQLRR
ncbi:hypothetical protein [Seongchinamella unica]|uniref:hypothetical protein n=1 Tax=Seongchinamella unica TaxID=2547392 RepID=UPI0014044233|nr:hypothetical protein [Seongchinamella unica]